MRAAWQRSGRKWTVCFQAATRPKRTLAASSGSAASDPRPTSAQLFFICSNGFKAPWRRVREQESSAAAAWRINALCRGHEVAADICGTERWSVRGKRAEAYSVFKYSTNARRWSSLSVVA